jgi:hypothetical protein
VKRFFHFLLLCLVFCTCLEEKNLTRLLEVYTRNVYAISDQGASFKGSIKFENHSLIVDHGFVWGKFNNLVFNDSVSVSLGAYKGGEFSATLRSGLDRDTYYVRAFAKVGDRIVYGNAVIFRSLGSEGPKITSLNPSTGSAGDTVTIIGRNLVTRPKQIRVTFGYVSARVLALSDSSVTVIVPSVTAAQCSVTYSVLGYPYVSPVDFKLARPELTEVSKTTFDECETITVMGKNFDLFGIITGVFLNGESANLISLADDRFEFSYDGVSLQNPVNLSVTSNFFTISAPFTLNFQKPIVTGVIPSDFFAGDTISISGDKWPACENVNVRLISSLPDVQPYSTNASIIGGEIKFVIPSDKCLSGLPPYDIELRFSKMVIKTGQRISYRKPVISVIEPTHGTINDEVTIKGYGFPTDLLNVQSDLLTLTFRSDTEYRGIVRDVVTAVPAIEVYVMNCGEMSDPGVTFSFDPPEISSVTPGIITSPGEEIVINGKNFSPADNEMYFRDRLIANAGSDAEGGEIRFSAGTFIKDNSMSEKISGYLNVKTKGQLGTTPTLIEVRYETAWTTEEDFPGSTLFNNVSMAVNGKGYVGLGATSFEYLKEWWEFDADNRSWTRKADFPGTPNGDFSGTTANGKAFVGIGNNDNSWWEYDPALNKWTRKADFPGVKRYGNFLFAIGKKIYAGGGYSAGVLNDLWEYDAEGDTWLERKAPPKTINPMGLVYAFKGKAYGYNIESGAPVQMAYDPDLDEWTSSNLLTEDFRADQGDWRTLIFDEKVFCLPVYGSLNPFLADPEKSFISFAGFPGSVQRYYPACFVVGDKGYIIAGQLLSTGSPTHEVVSLDITKF